MNDLIQSKLFGILLTFLIFFIAQQLYQKFKYFFLNPILISIGSIILFLKFTGIEYAQYNHGAQIISFFLGPAVVALGVALHQEMEALKKAVLPILASVLTGSITGIVSVLLIAKALGASEKVLFSIAPKSVTTPIAMGIAEKLGGIPSLTAVLVILTGILGAVLGPLFLNLIQVRSRIARGFSMGMASHGIGTARVLEEGNLEGAMGGLGISLNGMATAIFTPLIVYWLIG